MNIEISEGLPGAEQETINDNCLMNSRIKAIDDEVIDKIISRTNERVIMLEKDLEKLKLTESFNYNKHEILLGEYEKLRSLTEKVKPFMVHKFNCKMMSMGHECSCGFNQFFKETELILK